MVISATLVIHASVATGETASDPGPFDRPGFYMGAGDTYQRNPFNSRIEDAIQDALPGANSSVDLDDSFGINGLLDYRVRSFLALELQYEWVDKYDFKGTIDVPVPVSGNLYSIEGHTLTASTKWIIPFWRIQPYFLLGGGVAISDVSRGNLATALTALGRDVGEGTHAKPAARTGLGLDLYITEHIALNAQASAVITTLKEPGTSTTSMISTTWPSLWGSSTDSRAACVTTLAVPRRSPPGSA